MRGSFKVRSAVAVAACAIGATIMAAPPASADTAAAVITGTLTYEQGLTTGVAPQSFTLAASGPFTSDLLLGSGGCRIDGPDDIASLDQGSGTYTGFCETGFGEMFWGGTFVRHDLEVTFTGQVSEPFFGNLTAYCELVPLPEVAPGPAVSASALKTFEAACEFTIA